MFSVQGVAGARLRWRGAAMALLLAVGPGVAVHAATIDSGALHLRLAPALSGNDGGETQAAGQQAILPVLLGISSLRNRLEHARLDAETWRQANQALGAHLTARERHLGDLQHLVAVQDDTIAAMQEQVQAFVDFDRLASAALVMPDAPATAPPVTTRQALPGAILARIPYVESGMLLVIVALLAWVLYLRAQTRSAERALAGSTLGPGGLPAAHRRRSRSASPCVPVGADVGSLFLEYERSAEALLGAFGDPSDSARHRDDLLRGLSAVADRDTFLGEALAVARARGDESRARRIARIMEESGCTPAPDTATASLSSGTESSTDEEDSSDEFDLVFSTAGAADAPQASALDTIVIEPEAHAAGLGTGVAPPAPGNGPKVPADPEALKEIDTLIAFENYDQASSLLEKRLREAPGNPEYRLRLLHILSAAGKTEASAEQEEILARMMDAPLSETLARVRNIGRDLLPGHPLFSAGAEDGAGESAFERGPLFDVTVGTSRTPPDAAPAGQDAASADADVGDFMKSAFEPDADPEGSGSVLSLEPMETEMPADAGSKDAASASGESSDSENEFSATVFDLPAGRATDKSDGRA